MNVPSNTLDPSAPQYCAHCRESLRIYTTTDGGRNIERAIFRTNFAEDGSYQELAVHLNCARYMYGKFSVVGFIMQSKADYPLRPEARFMRREITIELTPEQMSRLMDIAEMNGLSKDDKGVHVPCTDKGLDRALTFYAAKGQLWPSRQWALDNNVAVSGKKLKKIYIPEDLEKAGNRGDITRAIKGKLADEGKMAPGGAPKSEKGS